MITAGELAEIVRGELEGDPGKIVNGISHPDNIIMDTAVYIEKQADAWKLERRQPAAVICSRALKAGSHNLIRCSDTRLSFGLAMRYFFPPEEFDAGIHPTAVVEEGAAVSPEAFIGAGCFVGAGAYIGEKAVIHPGCCIGRNASVGDGCVFHPNVSFLDMCEAGKRVILHSGCVIGGDGFGYVNDEGLHMKVPQVGNVIIEDDVEVGANTAIDRATLGSTRIGRGTKIDNMVQIGHNCRIGENCIICGSVGISGSCTLGDGVVLAGQVGLSDHITIGEGAILGGKSGVYENVPPNVFYSGFPARPHRKSMRIVSLLERLPELAEKIDRLSRDPDPEED